MSYLQELCEFQIDETFRVPEVGTVVGGLLTKGVITEGAELVIGNSLQKQKFSNNILSDMISQQ